MFSLGLTHMVSLGLTHMFSLGLTHMFSLGLTHLFSLGLTHMRWHPSVDRKHWSVDIYTKALHKEIGQSMFAKRPCLQRGLVCYQPIALLSPKLHVNRHSHVGYDIWHIAYDILHMRYGISHMQYRISHVAYAICHITYRMASHRIASHRIAWHSVCAWHDMAWHRISHGCYRISVRLLTCIELDICRLSLHGCTKGLVFVCVCRLSLQHSPTQDKEASLMRTESLLSLL